MANNVKEKQPIKFLFDQWQKSKMYAKRYMVETYIFQIRTMLSLD